MKKAKKSKKRAFALMETIISVALTTILIYFTVLIHGYTGGVVKRSSKTFRQVENFDLLYGYMLRDSAAATEVYPISDGFVFKNGEYSVTYTINEGTISRQGETLCTTKQVSFYVLGDYIDLTLDNFEYGNKRVRFFV